MPVGDKGAALFPDAVQVSLAQGGFGGLVGGRGADVHVAIDVASDRPPPAPAAAAPSP